MMNQNEGFRSPVNDRNKNKRRALALGLFVAVLAAAWIVYGRVSHYDFVNWDDDLYVYNNPFIRDFSLSHLRVWFSRPFVALYVPVPLISYALDYQLYGLNASGFHITNVLLHAFNTFLVFLLFRRLGIHAAGGALAAAVFLIHPAQVESVAWISQRKNLLFAFFLLSGLILWVRAPNQSRAQAAERAIAIGCFLLSFLSKATAIVIPVILIGYEYFYNRGSARKGMAASLFLFIPAAALAFFTIQLYPDVLQRLGMQGIGESLRYSVIKLAHYLKLTWPLEGRELFYPEGLRFLGTGLRGLPWIFAVLAMLTAFVYYAVKRRKPGFWLLLFFTFLLPVANFFTIPTADRHLYVPIIGLTGFIIAVSANRKMYAYLLLGGIVAASIPATLSRIPEWRNSKTLWESTESVPPSRHMTVGTQLGGYYEEKGNYEEAEKAYWSVIRRNPILPYPYINLYNIYVRQEMPEKAGQVAGAFRRQYTEEHELKELYEELLRVKARPEDVKRLMQQVMAQSRHPERSQ